MRLGAIDVRSWPVRGNVSAQRQWGSLIADRRERARVICGRRRRGCGEAPNVSDADAFILEDALADVACAAEHAGAADAIR